MTEKKRRLADEYDAAQERGEVAKDGRPKTVPAGNGKATAADLGLSRKQIHDARLIRDTEKIENQTSAPPKKKRSPKKSKTAKTAAERMRAYRIRKRAGDHAFTQALIEAGRLAEWDEDNPAARGEAEAKLHRDYARLVTLRNGRDPLADAMVADNDNQANERTGDHEAEEIELENADARDAGDGG